MTTAQTVVSIPRKDAANPTNRPDVAVRRRWIRRIPDHNGTRPWIDSDGPAYLRARLSQAPRDTGHALDVVTELCRSTDDQARAVAALSLKCDLPCT